MNDAELAALRAIRVADCPACGRGDAALRPDRRVTEGIVVRCLSCGAMVVADESPNELPGSSVGYRDGIMAWNRWAAKARRIRERREGSGQ